ncbi:GH25 family lysozyme [Beduini massiliensis]|uniref:GH25 family lysozyme n=1 Tax=Beduini massiliensis TaxID=1585974 RepID=UPI000693A1A7|nr:GH25 family lysozyme [Beduini massiliensis]
MSLLGIDISSWQDKLDLSRINCDFVIVKATEGVGYINPCCDLHFQKANDLNKKVGFYHFARNSMYSAEIEADYFINHTKGYFGKGIPILDWEDAVEDVGWALKWLQIVESKMNVKPMIYMSESVVNAYDWTDVAKAGYGLWVAKYKGYDPVYNYDSANRGAEPAICHWPFYAMWQFTSCGRLDGYEGNLDCNIFYGDGLAWDQYVKVGQPSVDPTPFYSKYKIGDYVTFGSCYASSTSKIGWPPMGEALVPDIKEGIITAIYEGTNNPYLINNGMCFINDGDIHEIKEEFYIVQSGDVLSEIAMRFNTTYQDLAKLNQLENPDLIYPGQKLKIQ